MWDRFRNRDADVDRFKVRLGDGLEVSLTGTSSVTPEPTGADYLPTSIDLPLPANAVRLAGGHQVQVTGESHYVDAFDAVFGPRRREGARMGVEVTATLVTDPSNPYDRNAVVVMLAGQQCGYLPRQVAETLAPVIAMIEASGHIPACDAIVTGGWDRGGDDHGDYGVSLDLASPDELLAQARAL